MTIGLGEGVGVVEMLVKGSRDFKMTGSGIRRGTAPNITFTIKGFNWKAREDAEVGRARVSIGSKMFGPNKLQK